MHNGRHEFRDSGQLGTSYTESADFGCQLIKTEENPNTGRLRLTFRFDGINLGKARFMVATTLSDTSLILGYPPR